MSYKGHFFGAWSGLIFIPLFGIGWMVFAGFIPPISPAATAAEVANLYQGHNIQIIIGMVFMLISIAFLVPYFGMMSVLMARIEGRWPVLAIFAGMSGVINVVYFVIPVLAWLTVAFRPEQSPEIIRVFNDFGWFTMLWPFSSTVMQNVLFGIVILSDKREKPLLPRWLGFFSIMEGTIAISGGLIGFFTAGPFAWNGIISFWLVAIAYLVWMFFTSIEFHKSVKTIIQEESQLATVANI